MKKVLLGLALLNSGIIFAENIASSKLDETVVSVEKFETNLLQVSKNITIITEEEIKKSGAQEVEEVLRIVPGVFLNGANGKDFSSDIILRGQVPGKSGQNILVLVDGSSINSSTDTGNFDLNLIPIETIERIEVVPNGGTVLYGEGAVGGVINIITKNPKNKDYYGQIGVDRGNQIRNYNVNIGSKVTSTTGVEVTYLNKLTDGYRHHSEKDLEYVGVKGSYEGKDSKLIVGYKHGEKKSKFSGTIDKKDKKKSNSTTEAEEIQDVLSLNYEKSLNEKLKFLLNSDYKEREYSSTSEKKINGINKRVPSTNRDTKTYYINPQIKYSYWNNSYLILGIDYSKGESDYQSQSHTSTGSSTTNTFTDRKSIGTFMTNNLYYKDFLFTQGLRYQSIDYELENRNVPSKSFEHSFNEKSYELTGTYFVNDNFSTYLTYNRAFRAPTADEAGSWNSVDGKFDIQTSDTIEIGGKGYLENIYFSTAIYHSKTEKEIFYLTKASGETSSNYNFFDPILRTGVEILSEQYIDKLTLKESISYIHHEVDGGKYDGKKVPGVPNFIASLGVNYELIENLNINTTLLYRGGSYAMYDYQNKLGKQGGYTEVNLSINYTLDNGIVLYGGVNNLFDKEYYYAKASTSKDTISYYPGTKRNYFIGFKYNF